MLIKVPNDSSQLELEFMLMKHYAPNRCEPSIEFRGGGGGIRADVNGEVNFLGKLKKNLFFLGGGKGVGCRRGGGVESWGRIGGGGGGLGGGGVGVDVNREVKLL